MKNKPAPETKPLTFDLTQAQVSKVEAVRKKRGLRSASEVVRAAIAELDMKKVPVHPPRFRQISVRFEDPAREDLRRKAKSKNLSIGELLRLALERL